MHDPGTLMTPSAPGQVSSLPLWRPSCN